MQIVIDISEEYYNEIKEHENFIRRSKNPWKIAVLNGTVLPEKHGDLIDRDKLELDCYELEIHDGDDWRNEYCGVSETQIAEAEVVIKSTNGENE